MKTFNKICAQGDMMLIKIDAIPATAVAAPAENGKLVLTHSESGHDHCVMERPAKSGGKNAQMFIDKTNEFIAYLSVAEPCDLEHNRAHDKHETIRIDPGNYEIRRQREYTAEGFRRAQD